MKFTYVSVNSNNPLASCCTMFKLNSVYLVTKCDIPFGNKITRCHCVMNITKQATYFATSLYQYSTQPTQTVRYTYILQKTVSYVVCPVVLWLTGYSDLLLMFLLSFFFTT